MGSLKSIKVQENVSKFLEFLESIESASPLTVKSYTKDLEQAFDFKIDEKSSSLSLTEEELLIQARKSMLKWRNLSPASRNRKAATLKSFFNYLHQEKKIERNLSSLILSPKVPKKLPNYISVDEAIGILKIAENKERLLFLLLYGGGLRVSEACTLKWSQVDLHSHTLRIRGKGNQERISALPDLAILELKKVKNKAEFIWGDSALNPRTAYNMIQKLGLKAGLLRPLHPHALRHSFATHLLSSGANLRTLQELLGHKSLTATEKYTHLTIDQLARTMNQHHPLGELQKRSSKINK